MCKADRSPVTAADREIESTLRQVIHERYPHHAIIGEEYGTVRGCNYSWILDPIGGTKSFVMGNPLFGTLIGLVHEDEAVIGLIDIPATGEQWAGDANVQGSTTGSMPARPQSAAVTLLSRHGCTPRHRHILPAPMNEMPLIR